MCYVRVRIESYLKRMQETPPLQYLVPSLEGRAKIFLELMSILAMISFGFWVFSKKFSWDAVKVLEEYDPSKHTSVAYYQIIAS